MRFHLRHTTLYRYEQPVALGPHVIRQQPRADAFLRLDAFRLSLHPRPRAPETSADPEGNLVTAAAFDGLTQEFRVAMEASGETAPRVVPPEAEGLLLPALNYSADRSFREAWRRPGPDDDAVKTFADEVLVESGPGALAFLDALARRMHARLRDVSRLMGAPHDPAYTLQVGQGSCRDFAVLFVACCRSQGLAARFVSGYLPAAPGERQHMHAWAEALLPGVGWIPYDATRGGLAGPEHIPVAAAAEAADAAPLTGTFTGAGRSEMMVEMSVEMS